VFKRTVFERTVFKPVERPRFMKGDRAATRFAALGGAGLDGLYLDRRTGLLWRPPAPGDGAITFDEAVDRAIAANWRLPTAAELMDVLCDGQSIGAAAEEIGTVFWTRSESPSAPATEVRVVACEPGPLYVVALRDKTGLAKCWLTTSTPSPHRLNGVQRE
jgi:hypothetical protein